MRAQNQPLGLEVDEWVRQHLGGYDRLSSSSAFAERQSGGSLISFDFFCVSSANAEVFGSA
jgi:hypothetical protein